MRPRIASLTTTMGECLQVDQRATSCASAGVDVVHAVLKLYCGCVQFSKPTLRFYPDVSNVASFYTVSLRRYAAIRGGVYATRFNCLYASVEMEPAQSTQLDEYVNRPRVGLCDDDGVTASSRSAPLSFVEAQRRCWC